MSKRFVSISEIAILLGVSISTVRRRIADGDIRVHRFGRQLRIERLDLDRYVEACRDGSVGEHAPTKNFM